MFNDYIGILTNPKETITKIVKRKIELKDSAILLLISSALVSMVSILTSATPGVSGSLYPLALIGAAIIATVITFFQTGFSVAIFRLIAKAVGGKGSYADNLAPFSFVVPLVALVSSLVSLIPIIGVAAGVLWWIYAIYLYIVTVSAANAISMKDAAIAVLAPIAILILILLVVLGPFIFLGAVYASMLGLNALT